MHRCQFVEGISKALGTEVTSSTKSDAVLNDALAQSYFISIRNKFPQEF